MAMGFVNFIALCEKGIYMKLDTDYIEKLADILNSKGITEITIEDGNQAISVKKEVTGAVVSPVQVPVSQAPAAAAPVKEEVPKGKAIVSPMVGTFYKASSPEAKPFVEVGQTVAVGDVVCIVEAMKLMNEIESEFAGKIVEICVEDGQPVEFGQVLMYVE